MVKWFAECERMFNCPIPKYTESAPELIAAARDSREPTGAIISKSVVFSFMGAKLAIFFVILPHEEVILHFTTSDSLHVIGLRQQKP